MKAMVYLFFFSINSYAQLSEVNISSNIDSSENLNGQKIFYQETSYIGDFVSNLSGGIKTGTAYLGVANIKIKFKTDNIALWGNGEFFINDACTHGATPTENLLGDFQVASNIEAGNNIFLQELWYRHNIDNLVLTLGLQDLNAVFVNCDIAGSFVNSSFGIPSIIANNVPAPIFPLTALGVTVRYQVNNSLAFRAAVFDGLPEDFENNPYNLNWNFKNDDGALFISEITVNTLIRNLPGEIKAGGYYHAHVRMNEKQSETSETVFQKNYGFYLLTTQTLWQKNENNKFCLFTHISASPVSLNIHNFYFGSGMNYTGLFNEDGSDEIGLGMAHARFRDNIVNHETTLEVFYKLPITENLFLQPDVQYIINPANANKN